MRNLIALTLIVFLLALAACQNDESTATDTAVPPIAEDGSEAPVAADEPAAAVPPTVEDEAKEAATAVPLTAGG